MWVPREAVETRASEARFFRYEAGFLTFDDRSGFGRANFLTYEAFFGFLTYHGLWTITSSSNLISLDI
jgi:hypothetical protein